MNAKTVKLLLAATAVVVLIAIVVQRRPGPGGDGEPLPERIAPDLTERINDVARLEVAGGEGTVELERREDGWVVASKAGYPAKFETVKEAIVAIAQLEPLERKTADPARYDRLGLQDPGEGSDAVRVTMLDQAGGEIAGVVLGSDVSAGGSSQRYVRTVADPQAWLAEGRVNVPTDPLQWMDRDIMRIPRDRVTRVTITHPDGEVVSIAREQGGTNYALETVPEGRNPKSAGEIGAPASALAYLRLDDVRRADEPGLELGEPTLAVYETSSGLRVIASTWEVDGKTWAAFSAEAPDAPEAPEPETAEATDAAAAPTEDAAEPGLEEQSAPERDAEAVAKEAADLNAKLSGWLFAIPEYQAGSMRERAEDLTAAPEPAAQPTEGEEDGEPVFIPSLDARDDQPGGG